MRQKLRPISIASLGIQAGSARACKDKAQRLISENGGIGMSRNIWTGPASEVPALGFQGGPMPNDIWICTDTKAVLVCIETGSGTRSFVAASGNVSTGKIAMNQLPDPIDAGTF